MGRTKIEWTDETWNPLRARNKRTGGVGHYCQKVGPDCANCYAEVLQTRFRNSIQFRPADLPLVEPFLDHRVLLAPFAWARPRKIFPCDMTDLFGHWVPDEQLDLIFAVMALTPRHTYQVLTKRTKRMAEYFLTPDRHNRIELAAEQIARGPATFAGKHVVPRTLPNVWLGASCGNQATADARLPHLVRTPAAIRFVSAEPLIGPLNLTPWLPHFVCTCGWSSVVDPDPKHQWEPGTIQCPACRGFDTDFVFGGLDLVISGGESGKRKHPAPRPSHPAWARSLRDQCVPAGVCFFWKQWGEWVPVGSGYELEGDSVFRSDGVITGRIARVRYAEHLEVKRGRQSVAMQAGPDEFGNTIKETPIGVTTESSVEHDERLGSYTAIRRVGKKRAGRLLDGREWNELPETLAHV